MADPSEASPSPALLARRLLRGLDRASLATSYEGWPYASLVIYATAPGGAPLLLLSNLARHTQNIAKEPRVSLLLDGTAGLAEPLTGPRVSLLGRAERVADEALLTRFRRRHPSAEGYAGFGDFNLYRLAIERAHLVAGFGRITWIEAAALLPPGLDALAAIEEDVLTHMNEDHGAAICLYAQRLCGQQGEGWRMTGIDAEGCDLRAGGAVARRAQPSASIPGSRQPSPCCPQSRGAARQIAAP
jgi:putative heme iron utilization protein